MNDFWTQEPQMKIEYVRWLIGTGQIDEFPMGPELTAMLPEHLTGKMPRTLLEVYRTTTKT